MTNKSYCYQLQLHDIVLCSFTNSHTLITIKLQKHSIVCRHLIGSFIKRLRFTTGITIRSLSLLLCNKHILIKLHLFLLLSATLLASSFSRVSQRIFLTLVDLMLPIVLLVVSAIEPKWHLGPIHSCKQKKSQYTYTQLEHFWILVQFYYPSPIPSLLLTSSTATLRGKTASCRKPTTVYER